MRAGGRDWSAYVCLPCRSSFKHGERRERLCPRCAKPLVHAGDAFEAPPRRDADAWRVVTLLLNAGVGFHQKCCGCGPGYRPRTMREVRERMAYARRSGVPVSQALVRAEL
ncbi:deoxyxylulose-5-phosphate synthase [Streptomyces sp. NPDC006208]|uniref:deoxyxylulose-5-phosphate synthase n=1 Tax=Streptomyces sp. NPDC006208 TaxID=3156734 RepID=UPI0033BCB848